MSKNNLLPANFAPDFNKATDMTGLITAIAQDAQNGEVLMLAFMNEEALKLTLESGEAHYYSRSRQKLWRKGESSGHVQKIVSIRLDCDSDAILLLVEQTGAACHEGYRTCFFRELKDGKINICSQKIVDPAEVYNK